MNIQTKVTLYTTLLVGLISAVLIGAIYYEISETFYNHILEQQENRMRVAHELLDRLGKPLHLVDGKMLAGDRVLNGDQSFVDGVSALMGGNTTVFQGNERIATNIRLPDGSRAVGTKFYSPAASNFFDLGQNYRGEANVLGEAYLTAYDSLRDGEGNVIGMLEVGAKKSSYAKALSAILLGSSLVVLAGVLIIGFMVYWALSKLTRELDTVNQNNRLLLKSTGSGIFEVDHTGHCLYINEAGARFLGGDPEDFAGRDIHQLIHATSGVSAEVCPLCRTFRNGETYQRREELLCRLDQSTFPAEIEASPLVDNTLIRGAVVVFHDQTERKKNAEEMDRKNREIETSRTALHAANQLKASLFSTVSTEIRTPMNGVMGVASVLMNSSLEVEQRRLTESIYQSGESLLHLFDLMEDYSLLDSGQLTLEKGSFGLAECLDFVLAELETTAKGRGIDVVYHLDEKTPAAFNGDEVRLQQILYTLIGDAILSSKNKPVKITINTTPLGSTQFRVEFAITNCGLNIPPQKVTEILRETTPAKILAVQKYEANSLGLAVSKGLAELMGGSMQYSSTLSSEPVLLFTILAESSNQTPRSFSGGIAPVLENTTLLLGVQDEMSRLILQRYAHNWGMHVLIADHQDHLVALAGMPSQPNLAVVQKHFAEVEVLGKQPFSPIPLVELTLDRQSTSPVSLRGTAFNARIHAPIVMKLVKRAFLSALMRRRRLT